jgi:type I restriction enzyme M protein
VTLWILNRNKKARTVPHGDLTRQYRDRADEILFMDLRKWGSEFEKAFIELTPEDIQKVVENFHNWQQFGWEKAYKDIPEFCYSASFAEIKEKDFSLIPSKYIPFVDRDSGINFENEMQRIQHEFSQILAEEESSQRELIAAFKGLGYAIKA